MHIGTVEGEVMKELKAAASNGCSFLCTKQGNRSRTMELKKNQIDPFQKLN